jgi:hypothetical protein
MRRVENDLQQASGRAPSRRSGAKSAGFRRRVWLLAVALRQHENLDAAGGDANRVRDLRDSERRPCARRASVCTCVNGISLEPANGAI